MPADLRRLERLKATPQREGYPTKARTIYMSEVGSRVKRLRGYFGLREARTARSNAQARM